MRIFTLAITAVIFLYSNASSQQEIKVNASDGASGDQMGAAVSMWNDVCISGARLNNDVAVACGTAYVFRKNGNSWVQEQKLVASDAGANDNFGVSVDVHNDIVIVGANLEDQSGTDRGAAYIFRFNGTSWVEEQKLIAYDAEDYDEFGFSVAVFDTIAVVGAYRDDEGGTNTGSVYIYHYDGTGWNAVQKINGQFPAQDDFFGYTVDVYNGRIAVGVYQDDDNGINSGSAYVFKHNGTNYTIEQKLNASNGAGGDAFGFSVSLKDSLCAIGAYGKNGVAAATGAVYVFKRTGTSWAQQQIVTAPDASQDDWLGFSCSLDGKTLVAGSFHDDDLGPESGAFYLWRFDGSSWIYEFKRSAADGNTTDEFAQAVSIYDMDLVVGSPKNDDNGSNSGSVYFYPLCTYTPVQEICIATVNTGFNDNLLIWQKPVTTFIDSFYIYRSDGFSDQKIAAVRYSSNGDYIDNSVNLISGVYSYRLTTLNICGNESDTGNTHKIIHLSAAVPVAGQAQLNWTPAAGFSFPYYRIWRDTTGSGIYSLIAATLNSQFSFTDNNLPASANLWYYIEVQKGSSCSSGSFTKSSSVSNRVNPYTNGMTEINLNFNFSLFPNPAENELTVLAENNSGSPETSLHITGIDGRMIYSETKKGNLFTISIQDYPNGIYLVTVISGNAVLTKRLSVIR